MEQQHECRAAGRAVEPPPSQCYEEDIEQDDQDTAAEPDHHEFVQLHTAVCTSHRHTVKPGNYREQISPPLLVFIDEQNFVGVDRAVGPAV